MFYFTCNHDPITEGQLVLLLDIAKTSHYDVTLVVMYTAGILFRLTVMLRVSHEYLTRKCWFVCCGCGICSVAGTLLRRSKAGSDTQFKDNASQISCKFRSFIHSFIHSLAWSLNGVTVRASDLPSSGRGFDGRPGRYGLHRSTQPSIPPG